MKNVIFKKLQTLIHTSVLSTPQPNKLPISHYGGSLKLLMGFIMLLNCLGCSSLKVTSVEHQISVLNYNCTAEFLEGDGHIDTMINQFDIIRKGKYTIYSIPILEADIKTIYSANKDSVINEFVPNGKSFCRYYVILDGQTKGHMYSLKYPEESTDFRLDSLLRNCGISDKNLSNLSMDLGKPTAIVKDKGSFTLAYYRLSKSINDVDSIYRYFNKRYNKLHFTLSASLDKRYRSKMWQYKAIFNPIIGTGTANQPEIPKRTIMFRIKPKYNYDQTVIDNLIEKFENDNY